MAEKEGLTIDDMLEHVGSCGLYQIRFVLILSYLMGLAVILPVAQLAFLTAQPPWKCATNSSVCNMTGTFRQGDHYYKTRCTLERSDWEFVDSFTSVVTEFDLVCDRTFLGSFSSSILFLGWLFAALCGGVIADKFGRKSVMIISSFLTSVFSLLSAFPTVYWLFALIRFVTGFFVGCGCMPLFVVLVEYVGVRHRHMASTCIWFSSATCFLLMSAFAYGIRNWRHLILVTSAMGLPSILFWWLVPESARFLQLKDRFKETETILRKIAVTNNKIYPEKPLVKYNEDGKEQVMGSFKDLFRTRHMTHITLVSCFSWFVNAMVFYGVVFSSPGLGTNMYVSFALATVVNIPSHALCIYCMGKFGRKKTVVFANIFASLSAIATVLLTMYDPGSNSGYKNGQLVTAILAKMGITISFDGIYVYSAELFPTVIRNVGMGASSASGRVGSFAAPFVISLNYVHVLLPYTIMGAASLLAGVLCWTLPETKSVPTAEVMSSPCQDAKKPSQTDMEDSLL